MTLFLTADTHFNHANIIKYCSRPFSSKEEMDETLIANWNGMVHDGDTIYMVGDFAFVKKQEQVENYLRRLNGTKILITGNHDYEVTKRAKGWSAVYNKHYELSNVDDRPITLNHFPMARWEQSHRGAVHFFGHVHGTYDGIGHSLDVGVDSVGMAPIEISYAISLARARTD